MEVSGQIGIFENQKACKPLSKHLLGRMRFAQWGFIAIMLVGDLAVSWLFETLYPGSGWLGVLLFTVAALFVWNRYCRTLVPKAWMARGVPAASAITYRIEDQVLVLQGDLTSTHVAWSGVSQIAPGNAAWLFIGSGQAWFLPTRFFADRQQERAFLADCLGKLSAEAKVRSPEAVALVEADVGPWGVARP
ncbi:YcxB family protein [Caulobacter soli]|uniref:YcxB family protein n=1 Tax=Caulobacter soli TaxID=2708539 RepID=UPI0013E9F811|nr:YcxB family protein [Caulobacter soli]